MIHFDKKTLSNWKEMDIKTISVYFYESGCAWTKIQVEIGKSPLCDREIFQEWLTFYVKNNEFHLIDEWKITHVWNKWIFQNSTINTRCWCWSSFSLKSESPLQDKIARMKLAMKEKKDWIHK